MDKQIKISLVASLIATTLGANQLANITVTSTPFTTTEIKSTSSVEIYTQEDIKESKSSNIYDFLNLNTSIVTIPKSGNNMVHSLDIRGYGTTNGFKSIIVTVNGKKLNNIDNLPQFLSAININQIERIEIIKGGASVLNGDGANAGSINIITNGQYTNSIKAYTSSNDTRYSTASLGFNYKNFIINGAIDYYKTDGNRFINSSNTQTDQQWQKNKEYSIYYFPNDDTELFLSKQFNKSNSKYSNSLTLDEFNNAINKYGSEGSSSQAYQWSNNLHTTFKYYLSNIYNLDFSYMDEKKENTTYSTTKYKYNSYDLKLNYKHNNLKVIYGVSIFDGKAKGSYDITTKDNNGYFINSEYSYNNMIFNIGARNEKVDYSYNNGTDLNSYDETLTAWDTGINKQLNNQESIFVNINRSFQTPDIDMFFTYPAPSYTKTFNHFLKTTISKNINIGYNKITSNNKFKTTLFYSKLNNEIYLYKDTGSSYFGDNENIDKSKKYGLEIFNRYKINKNLSTTLNYNYIIAKIIEEDSENGEYNGNYMPDVSKHNLTLSLDYQYLDYHTILNHKYRSEAYASEDFKNDNTQKTKAYHNTNLSVIYNIDKNKELFVKINNLFDKKNGIWLRDDVIRPVDFERKYTVGLNAKF
jgi:iron complex outermembrane receptor protein